MKRLGPILLLCAAGVMAEDVPLLGIAHVAVRVSDIGKSRGFYNGVLGFDEAFDFEAEGGAPAMTVFKVNDRQFVEVFPGIRTSDEQGPYLTHIGFIAADLDRAHEICERLGLKPSRVNVGPRDHDRHFIIRKPPGQKLAFLEFMQYRPESIFRQNEGKSLSARRISTRIEHAGIITTDLDGAIAFYEKMGFKETWRRDDDNGHPLLIHLRMPGPSGDYIELSVRSGGAEMTRKQMGSAAHFSLKVPDIKAAYAEAENRGQKPAPPRFGRDNRWQFNMFDSDSTRVECMQ